ncbi:OmpA family protein [Aquimarina sp. TRL1]|uniref:OmpA family protein n=1 Tax=Aquimarina sp. (strain TRL1) TaxID=2736252 RepID=UPI00158F632B|nr:OmpA family protein [Aquimarina sp. TRL1]QKX05787.1 OmpA family protein [Aquimarina sp. TRL1]
MVKKIRISIILMAVLSSVVFSQEKQLTKADNDFERFAFVDARKVYLKVAEKGFSSASLYKKIGDSYYFNGELDESVSWYERLISEYGDDMEPEYLFRYAQGLKSKRRYEEADRIMEAFYTSAGNDLRASSFMSTRNYLDFIDMQSGKFQLLKLSVNSPHSDYAPSFNHQGQLIFASSREGQNMTKTLHEWNEMPFLDLYSSDVIEGNGDLSAPKKLKGKINTKFHESSTTFSKDGKTMYFTRNNYSHRKVGTDSKGTILLKLYKATLDGNKWKDVEELPFNSEEYSVAHPSLSADGKQLYFASDMPGSYGLSDIYVVDILEDGGYGTPRNLGDHINTEGRETFPYISDSGVLYFSSDGHTGLGGLDVYISIQDHFNFSVPYNVGRPINGPRDDFSFVLNEATKMGYFASNRDGGIGNDDIYSFRQKEDLIASCKQMVSGNVTDEQTSATMGEALVVLLKDNGEEITRTLTDDEGKYSFEIDCNTSYLIRASQVGYSPSEELLTTNASLAEQYEVSFVLKQGILEEKEVEEGDDLAKLLSLEEIYFDLDKSKIRPDAEVELQKIIVAMKEYPQLRIDVRSHTDSRGDDSYNLRLSDRRAKSTIKYIIEKGEIDPGRVTGKGYGETELVNKCEDGVPCATKEHQENRRSEFIIVK